MFPRTSVFVLDGVGSPPTISGLISAIVVNSIERKAGRFFTHIRKEVFEAVTPSVADANSARTVVSVIFNSIFVVTARKHFSPSAIGFGPFTANGVTMCATILANYFAKKTATRARVTSAQITCAGSCFSATNATATPINENDTRRSSVTMGNAENGQTSEGLTCDIFQGRHQNTPAIAIHLL